MFCMPCAREKKLRSVSSLFPFLADAALKEKLKKIISSDFFTATPEMKAPVEVAAAVGQLHISEGSTVPSETAEGDIDTLDNKVISHMLRCKYIFAFFFCCDWFVNLVLVIRCFTEAAILISGQYLIYPQTGDL